MASSGLPYFEVYSLCLVFQITKRRLDIALIIQNPVIKVTSQVKIIFLFTCDNLFDKFAENTEFIINGPTVMGGGIDPLEKDVLISQKRPFKGPQTWQEPGCRN